MDQLKCLQAFAENEPAYRQAVENLFQDIRSEGNPNGNIGPERTKALAGICNADSPLPLPDAIAECQTIRRPDLAEPVPRPDAPLRRVMSLTCFVTYHLLHVLGGRADINNDAEELIESLKMAIVARNEPEEYDIEDFLGSTGQRDTPTWWTFREDADQPTMGNGERYLRELALSEATIEEAMNDGMAIEAIVPGEIIPKSLYKPCALDSFQEETRFRPDLGDVPFGRTVPADSDLVGHPELISQSFSYHEMSDKDVAGEIRLTVNPLFVTRAIVPHATAGTRGNTP
uniref:Uncharacterized protein n=1 Tax=Candidatus Kentrum sp. TUN TaxID=2126343 RepID=A0A450ZHG5_9GAMM|nr:MAG: hypothetical protein BECKTUN1418F_GA0071002_101814 [Candidatus Kentron sp. TUN]VFK54066.1 MAG: hypothetical protein BECKTUN1418E_GA0071001_102014 [Candidatus Kentron sp. TUN]